MPELCPLGTPSLLNGDFWENAARLKDFSWSVLLSSDPSNSSNPNQAQQSSIGSEIVHFFREHSIEVTIISLIFLYTAIYSLISYKFISWMKINFTRSFVVSFSTIDTVFITSFTIVLVFHRTIPLPVFAMIVAAYFHILIPCSILHFKCFHLQPLTRESSNFGHNTLRIVFVIITMLAFLFTPSIPHEHGKCPAESLRALSEMYFWLTFVYMFNSYLAVRNMLSNYQANVFYIYENSWRLKRVGEFRKKEGFGWIKDCYDINHPVILIKE